MGAYRTTLIFGCFRCCFIMLSNLSLSVRSTGVKIVRSVSTSKWTSQQAQPLEGEEHATIRPAPTQMKTMLDIGTRNIFTPEQDMFRESTRKFMRDVLAPQQDEFEKNGQPSREAWRAMGEQGLIGISTPAEVGGIGGTFIDEMIACEEMSYAFVMSPAMALHSTIVMPYLTHYGTKEQQERYLPRMTSGECIGSIGMTEPDAGSDLQGIRTTAKKDGDDWIINGSKIYITNGWLTDCCVVVAKTGDEDCQVLCSRQGSNYLRWNQRNYEGVDCKKYSKELRRTFQEISLIGYLIFSSGCAIAIILEQRHF